MKTILIVDDDPYLTDLLRYALMREGFQVVVAESGGAAVHAARATPCDLILLDISLPDMDGFAVLGGLRAVTRSPVLMLTARDGDGDVIAGLEAGADDYIVKPFSMQVLIMRIRAVLRRAAIPHAAEGAAEGRKERTFDLGDALFYVDMNRIVGATTTIQLTPTQGGILAMLLRRAGQVVSAEHILDGVLGPATERNVNVVKTHIRYLRAKLEQLPNGASLIRTVPGVGYAAQRTAAREAEPA